MSERRTSRARRPAKPQKRGAANKRSSRRASAAKPSGRLSRVIDWVVRNSEGYRLAVVALFAIALVLLLFSIAKIFGGGKSTGGTPNFAKDPASTSEIERMALSALRPDIEDQDSLDQLAIKARKGFANPLFSKVPGGAVQSAERVSRYRTLIDQVAKQEKVNAEDLEAIVYLESAGRPTAMASNDISGAVGLTQIVASTGTELLGMKINLERSKRLTGQIARSKKQTRKLRLLAARREADPRFDPPQALAATARYLKFAKSKLGGRDDLAIASYHMGVGNLQNVLKLYGAGDVSYAKLYFGIDPLRTPKATDLMLSFGDDSPSYYWRQLAAREIMHQFREDRSALAAEAALQARKASSEDLMHPPGKAKPFAKPSSIKDALKGGQLISLPRRRLGASGVEISTGMGQLAPRLKEKTSLYRALRPGSLSAVIVLGAATRAGAQTQSRLVMTSSVRDREYQKLLLQSTIEATPGLSQHTTGWAFDLARSYSSRKQALAFQWALSRLQALDLIAWVREPEAIHVTASSETATAFKPILDSVLGR